jgi:hypothetical protein
MMVSVICYLCEVLWSVLTFIRWYSLVFVFADDVCMELGLELWERNKQNCLFCHVLCLVIGCLTVFNRVNFHNKKNQFLLCYYREIYAYCIFCLYEDRIDTLLGHSEWNVTRIHLLASPCLLSTYNKTKTAELVFMKLDIREFCWNWLRNSNFCLESDSNNGHFTWRPMCFCVHHECNC